MACALLETSAIRHVMFVPLQTTLFIRALIILPLATAIPTENLLMQAPMLSLAVATKNAFGKMTAHLLVL